MGNITNMMESLSIMLKNYINSDEFKRILMYFQDFLSIFLLYRTIQSSQIVITWDMKRHEVAKFIPDPDKYIENIFMDNEEQLFKEIKAYSLKSTFLEPYSTLYKNCIVAYEHALYQLVVSGLFSIIDGLLTNITGNSTTNFNRRLNILLNEDKVNKVSNNLFIFSFLLVIKTFFEYSKFDDAEPQFINRHWVSHGRTTKVYKKVDCLKLFNIIFSLLLFHEIVEKNQNDYMKENIPKVHPKKK